MTSPVKGFRKLKDPNKKQLVNQNENLKTAIEGLHAAQKFVMQQMMRMNQDVSHQAREIGAITNLVGTTQVADGEVLKVGDIAIIDFAGELEDGMPLENGSGFKTAIQLGSNSFIAGFEDGLVGAKVGDTLNLPLIFPENYGNKELSGTKITFKVLIVDALRDRVNREPLKVYIQDLAAKKAAREQALGAKNESQDTEVQEATSKEETQEQAQA